MDIKKFRNYMYSLSSETSKHWDFQMLKKPLASEELYVFFLNQMQKSIPLDVLLNRLLLLHKNACNLFAYSTSTPDTLTYLTKVILYKKLAYTHSFHTGDSTAMKDCSHAGYPVHNFERCTHRSLDLSWHKLFLTDKYWLIMFADLPVRLNIIYCKIWDQVLFSKLVTEK